jgi:hypothetical protein
MRPVSWIKDFLPDFLWMCAHVSDDNTDGMYAIAVTLDAIDEVLKDRSVELHNYGRLTQFEEFPEEIRAPVLETLEEQGIYDRSFPEGFAHALGMYPEAPGKWLIEPWLRRGLSVDPEAAQGYLANIVSESFHGQHLVATRVKYMYLRGLAKSGHLQIAPGMDLGDFLVRYPKNLSEDERSRAEPSFRAAFLAMFGGSTESSDVARLDWCQRFWRSNWAIYACVKHELPSSLGTDAPDRAEVTATLTTFREESARLQTRFEEVALKTDPDLYAPDRFEVLTGITSRVLRLVDGAVNAPLLWTDEYGAILFRSIIEAKILLRWLGAKNDTALYTQFKNYGRGKLKLLKLHAEDYIDSLEDVPEHLTGYLEHLDSEVNADIWEEYQEISVSSTFAGVTARNMAIEAGLKNDYDFVFAPASGSAHGDWTALDRYALTRCLNPLHMWHRIPDFDARSVVDPAGMQTALAMADEVVTEYISGLLPSLA